MEEIFDVYDKDRKSLNYTKKRGSQLEEHEYNVGVEDWIICNNKILMTQRSPLKSHPGQWEAPGGCSQTKETSWDTVKREIMEEVNFKLDQTNTSFRDTVIYKKQFVDIYQTQADIDLSKIKLQEEEVSDVRLISKNEFYDLVQNNLIVPSVLDRFNHIKEQLKIDW